MLRRLFIRSIGMGAAAFFLASCGGGDDAPTSGSGGADSASSSASMASASSSGSGGAGGAGGSGSTSFCEGATEIDFGELLDGDLAMTGQEDFYRFEGKKGQVLMIDVYAQALDEVKYDPTYLDSVVTLFDSKGTQIARNNDAIGFSTEDSRLYTILPAGGEYCFRVADCWTAIPNPSSTCSGDKDKLVTNYSTFLYELVDEPGDDISVGVESGNDPASATPLEYAKDNNGDYTTTTFWGTFKDQDDIDVFSFTMPSDLKSVPANTRTTGHFDIMPVGPNGDGSTALTGRIWVAAESAPDVELAMVDASKNLSFDPRLELGTSYLLFITRPTGKPSTNDFYFMLHHSAWGNPLEMEKSTGANDTLETAEAFKDKEVDSYIEGDLAMGAADVDYFIATVPNAMNTVGVSCGAQRRGSGLRGLTLSLLKPDGTPLAGMSSDTETETHFARVSNVSLGGATQVVLKVSAASQDPAVTEAFYQCGIHFK